MDSSLTSLANDKQTNAPSTTDETKTSTKTVAKPQDNDENLKRQKLKEKEETLRRLKLIKHYKSREDIARLDDLIEKWKKVSQQVLSSLFDHYVSENQEAKNMEMCDFLDKMKIEPAMVDYDLATECFKNQSNK